jgi:hypothetical protein
MNPSGVKKFFENGGTSDKLQFVPLHHRGKLKFVGHPKSVLAPPHVIC